MSMSVGIHFTVFCTVVFGIVYGRCSLNSIPNISV